MTTVLYGFRFSVYTWIVRAVLVHKGVEYRTVEVDFFKREVNSTHPFGRVPVLDHNGFRVIETSAITRYADVAFSGPPLQSGDLGDDSVANQIVCIADNYAYHPLVKQVFGHGYFFPAFQLEANSGELHDGLAASRKVLDALDGLVCSQGLAKTGRVSLADLHLGTMIAYLECAPEGAALLQDYPGILRWWALIGDHPTMVATRPALPGPGS